MRPVGLSIAGSDPCGGAGIQADLKTFEACDVHGASVVTTVTAQNTTGVRTRHDLPPAIVAAQLDAVFDDLPVAAIKTGLLPNPEVVEVVAARLRRPAPPLVVDPVLVATSGDALAEPTTVAAIRDRLLPLAALVTPNLAEAAVLTGRPVDDVTTMREAARALCDRGAAAVLVTGGHLAVRACDVLVTAAGAVYELDAPRLDVGLVHGTGCTLSAAIAAGLATGRPLLDAVRTAKAYVRRTLAASVALGRGSRLLVHHPGTSRG
jgi:hydroxymethylpyrimidine/phosphomethylpyrimidine kinase